MKQDNKIQKLSYDFAKSIIVLYKKLSEQKMYDIGRQLLRSGTSIGANREEGIGGQSKADFIHKMNIAYKEARETYYINTIKDPYYFQMNDYLLMCNILIVGNGRVVYTFGGKLSSQ